MTLSYIRGSKRSHEDRDFVPEKSLERIFQKISESDNDCSSFFRSYIKNSKVGSPFFQHFNNYDSEIRMFSNVFYWKVKDSSRGKGPCPTPRTLLFVSLLSEPSVIQSGKPRRVGTTGVAESRCPTFPFVLSVAHHLIPTRVVRLLFPSLRVIVDGKDKRLVRVRLHSF